ncbi:hypothetical protein KFK09_014982 [Dendrobium nobile]|uniref:RIN4 pathogenic type III effector avirulence factor Avr cleavage site domain-containing protein n=1 Tax=Dendrobium nobile TaxID=94219 RepID=A0A8T3B4V5_DENNO|nr:hypothetical protein KFK09_014982 [Dendrobium nobile]
MFAHAEFFRLLFGDIMATVNASAIIEKNTDRPLPKFGEWDVNDPASAESFTVIFNKARDERKTGTNAQGSDSPAKDLSSEKQGTAYSTPKRSSKKWLCCFGSTPALS